MSEAIKKLLENYAPQIKNRHDLENVKRLICKKYHLSTILNSDIFQEYQVLLSAGQKPLKLLENSLRKRSIRTLSGVAPVAVLTKPYPCPGKCVYCPHEDNVPTSYLSNEPAVMRAIRCQYNPYQQVSSRLKSLENNGHQPTKIELIVIGGTWSYLPTRYQYWYILSCFRAANNYPKNRNNIFQQTFSEKKAQIKLITPDKQNLSLVVLKKLLKKEQKKNETAHYQIIGITLETRPDYISRQELLKMRELGCTRVEIGVQVIDDDILKLNQRGHGVAEITSATKLLKQFGFKITYHVMPALPGSNPVKDLALFKQLFSDERFQPDQIKFYPTVVTHGSLLYRWYLTGKYQPYSDSVLQKLIIACKSAVPRYVRIMRLIRDIPGESIVAGNKITNLRQILKDQGVKCQCIRCREARGLKILKYQINFIKYPASHGIEYFISADSLDGQILYGFCRLRLDQNSPVAPAIIRELHVYGELVPIGNDHQIQHSGLGKELLKIAEKLVVKNKINRLAIISGVGVRQYYRHLGYHLQKTYLVKRLK